MSLVVPLGKVHLITLPSLSNLLGRNRKDCFLQDGIHLTDKGLANLNSDIIYGVKTVYKDLEIKRKDKKEHFQHATSGANGGGNLGAVGGANRGQDWFNPSHSQNRGQDGFNPSHGQNKWQDGFNPKHSQNRRHDGFNPNHGRGWHGHQKQSPHQGGWSRGGGGFQGHPGGGGGGSLQGQHWNTGQQHYGGGGRVQPRGGRDSMPDLVKEYIMRSFMDRPQGRGRY